MSPPQKKKKKSKKEKEKDEQIGRLMFKENFLAITIIIIRGPAIYMHLIPSNTRLRHACRKVPAHDLTFNPEYGVHQPEYG